MPYRTVYAGLDRETWFLLAQDERFMPQGVALIPTLLSHSTYNPANVIWKYYYRHYAAGRPVNQPLLKMTGPFLTTAWRKYHQFFLSIIQQQAKLIDFDADDGVVAQSFMWQNQTDLLVVNVWGMLPPALLNTPTYKTVNVHPSKLPQYRGAVPTLMTLKNHDDRSAVSYIILDETMDGGRLIGQHDFAVDSSDDYYTIEQKVATITRKTLLPDIKQYLHGNKPVAQDQKSASTTPKYYQYMRVDWRNENAADVYNKVNLYPFVEIFDYCRGKVGTERVALKRIRYAKGELAPGAWRIHGWWLYVGAADKPLRCLLGKDISFRTSIRLLYKSINRRTEEEQ